MLCLEASHHRHILRPNVHSVTVSLNPFRNGKDCSLSNSAYTKFTSTDAQLANSTFRGSDKLVTHIANERSDHSCASTHGHTMNKTATNRAKIIVTDLIMPSLWGNTDSTTPLLLFKQLAASLKNAKVSSTTDNATKHPTGKRTAELAHDSIASQFATKPHSTFGSTTANATSYPCERVNSHACHGASDVR